VFFYFCVEFTSYWPSALRGKICGGVSRDFWPDFSALREKCFGGVFETLQAIAERFALKFVSMSMSMCGKILDVFFFTFALRLLAIGRALCAENFVEVFLATSGRISALCAKNVLEVFLRPY